MHMHWITHADRQIMTMTSPYAWILKRGFLKTILSNPDVDTTYKIKKKSSIKLSSSQKKKPLPD